MNANINVGIFSQSYVIIHHIFFVFLHLDPYLHQQSLESRVKNSQMKWNGPFSKIFNNSVQYALSHITHVQYIYSSARALNNLWGLNTLLKESLDAEN